MTHYTTLTSTSQTKASNSNIWMTGPSEVYKGRTIDWFAKGIGKAVFSAELAEHEGAEVESVS